MIFTLNGVIFEWDDEKYNLVLQQHNVTFENLVLQQHNVTFEEACSVFFDERSISKEDKRKYDEIRRVTTGMSNQARLLTVIWT